ADAAVLLSPAGAERIEAMAAASARATVERFGRTMFLYAPLYLSNECVCTCTYCGFSMGLDIRRRTLRIDEVGREARTLAERGMRNVLLVSAEHPKLVPAPYVAQCIAEVKRYAPYVGIEIAAATDDDYRTYVDAGCDGVVLYQETYDPDVFARHHLRGPKKHYAWRLDAPERAARAGVKHLGIGALLGLADWRFEALAMLAHARYLERHCWRSQLNVSVPRINAAAGGFVPDHAAGDRDLVQLICFLRLALPTAGIVLSTREHAAFRDRLVPLGVTHMSAGSSAEPGGYGEPGAAGEQFELEDLRTPAEVAHALRGLGYEPVFKDWERMAELRTAHA
ncbi:MAG TPA: 2-iminoacetate synthase ThiH, partial [Candidatus Eremiobacteraceae bacterium]|nr:2-iminoacetate synthase ThiH [Candidatus Eremiobacteraceae bacterium]